MKKRGYGLGLLFLIIVKELTVPIVLIILHKVHIKQKLIEQNLLAKYHWNILDMLVISLVQYIYIYNIYLYNIYMDIDILCVCTIADTDIFRYFTYLRKTLKLILFL